MIVNRLDYVEPSPGQVYGVGIEVLETGSHAGDEIELGKALLTLARETRGEGVVAFDCGANIGTHTVAWARHMRGWGEVHAIEAQERIFYALCGNIALHNVFNAKAMLAAVGGEPGSVNVPIPDYQRPASFGSLELVARQNAENIGQDRSAMGSVSVRLLTIDSLGLGRLDLLKLDVEGMELEVLGAAKDTVARCRPIIAAEHLKVGLDPLRRLLGDAGYDVFLHGLNVVAVHRDDPGRGRVRLEQVG